MTENVALTSSRPRKWFRRPEWLAVCACLALNASLIATVAVYRPAYLADYRLVDNPDARHYVLLGRNVFLHGQYSRNAAPPYVPDMLRTPIYPLFAGGLDVISGPWLIFIAQAITQAICCLLVYRLVQPRFGRRAATVAAFLLALDPMLAISNLQAMSEPLFAVLVLAAIVCLAPLLFDEPPGPAGAFTRRGISAGLLLATATLTRPAGLYLSMVLGGTILVRALLARRLQATLLPIGAMFVATLIPTGAWIARNAVVFSVPRLSTADAIMTVYFAGAGGYQVHEGIGLEDAQRRISKEFSLPPPEVTNNHWVTTQSVAEMDAALRAASARVLMKYPVEVVEGGLLGIIKSSLGHNVEVLTSAMGIPWHHPGGGALLRGEVSAAVGRLLQNHPLAVLLLFWSLAHTAITLVLVASFVAMTVLYADVRRFALPMVPVLAYFYLTVALVGAEAYFRSRSPHVPLLIALAGIAAGRLTSFVAQAPDDRAPITAVR